MTENTKVDIVIEEDTAIDINTDLEPPLMHKKPSTNASLSSGVLKSILIFGSSGVLICLVASLIFPSE